MCVCDHEAAISGGPASEVSPAAPIMQSSGAPHGPRRSSVVEEQQRHGAPLLTATVQTPPTPAALTHLRAAGRVHRRQAERDRNLDNKGHLSC